MPSRPVDLNNIKGRIAEALVESIFRRAEFKMTRFGRESDLRGVSVSLPITYNNTKSLPERCSRFFPKSKPASFLEGKPRDQVQRSQHFHVSAIPETSKRLLSRLLNCANPQLSSAPFSF
jgi:hypothetical protein